MNFSPVVSYFDRFHLRLPSFEPLEPEDLPFPFRNLLHHTNNMTFALESALGRKLVLGRVLDSVASDSVMHRWVVLSFSEIDEVGKDCKSDSRSIAAEFGSIVIYLDNIDSSVHGQIREARVPFATILRNAGVVQHAQPSGFFRTRSNHIAEEIFGHGMKCGQEGSSAQEGAEEVVVYGRCNTIRGAQGDLLAEVVELLSPGLASLVSC
jgi:hypothetical protein